MKAHGWRRPAVVISSFVLAYLLLLGVTRMSAVKKSGSSMTFYMVDSLDLWGDCGDILINGMTAHLGRLDGRLQLERTGPFMPPATLPGLHDMVITGDFRRKLETSGLGQFTFRPVVKARIVDLQWQKWDLKAENPSETADGEPEDYILGRPHSPKLADEMGDVWEVVLNDGAIVDTDIERKPWDYDVRVHAESWNGEHLFWGKKPPLNRDFGRWIIVTERGKQWLEESAGEWVRFKPLPVK
jgi:hypothetical protein